LSKANQDPLSWARNAKHRRDVSQGVSQGHGGACYFIFNSGAFGKYPDSRTKVLQALLDPPRKLKDGREGTFLNTGHGKDTIFQFRTS